MTRRNKLVKPGDLFVLNPPDSKEPKWFYHRTMDGGTKPKPWLYADPPPGHSVLKPDRADPVDVSHQLRCYMEHMKKQTGEYPKRVALYSNQRSNHQILEALGFYKAEHYPFTDEVHHETI